MLWAVAGSDVATLRVQADLGLFLVLVGLSSISSWGLIEPFAGCPFTVFGISPALPSVALGLVVLAVLALTFVGMVLRGPYWQIYWPWEAWPEIPGRI